VGDVDGPRLKLGEVLGDNDARIVGVKEGDTLKTTVGDVEGPALVLGLVLGVILPDGANEPMIVMLPFNGETIVSLLTGFRTCAIVPDPSRPNSIIACNP
jgi:hypothetical protein